MFAVMIGQCSSCNRYNRSYDTVMRSDHLDVNKIASVSMGDAALVLIDHINLFLLQFDSQFLNFSVMLGDFKFEVCVLRIRYFYSCSQCLFNILKLFLSTTPDFLFQIFIKCINALQFRVQGGRRVRKGV